MCSSTSLMFSCKFLKPSNVFRDSQASSQNLTDIGNGLWFLAGLDDPLGISNDYRQRIVDMVGNILFHGRA